MLFIVYVDDMKLSGPRAAMGETWKAFGPELKIEEPSGNSEGVHTYLGRTHRQVDPVINGKKARTMEHDVTAQLKKAISKYEEVVYGATGTYPKLEQ